MDVQTISARLPLDLYERLRREAFERRESMNAILVEALAKHLGEPTSAPTQQGRS